MANHCKEVCGYFKTDLDARAGDTVAVLGVGGLGHLSVQFAAKMGFRTVAIARGSDKEALAKELGAWRYIDSQAQDPAAELSKVGGASVILATVTNGKAMSAVMGGLAVNGKLMVLGAPESLEVSPYLLIAGQRSVAGRYSGTSIDSSGHTCVQRAHRRAIHERSFSA